ncbi:MAG: FCD domain-containing protein [Actinophytocola sp.]|nr:FCD domain-containing protein [Actinophytocola sp.]
MGDRSKARTTTTSRDVVIAELRQRILDLSIKPGSSVSENELANQLGVSRTPVRESLILLAGEGLIEIYPQVGTFVSRIDPAAVADAQFIREALETASLRELVATIDDGQIGTLRDILDQQQLAVRSQDVDRFFELDEQLHRTMMDLAGHDSAWTVVRSARAHLERARRASLPVADTLGRMLQQHTTIVDRLSSGSTDEAEKALRSHLREVFHDINEVKAQSPEYFANGRSRPTRRAHLS